MEKEVIRRLTDMRLHAMRDELIRQETFAMSSELSFDERIEMMVDKQWERKQSNRLKRLLRNAGIRDSSASLLDIEYSDSRGISKAKIVQLGSFSWIKNGMNLIVTGATGTGKSYIGCAFANDACKQGYRVKYYRTTRLVAELSLGLANARYTKMLDELKKVDLLVLDDFGIEKLGVSESRDILEVIDDRYTFRKSTIFSTQLPVEKWVSIFEDKTIADAILDRVVYNSIRLPLKGISMRESIGRRLLEQEN